MNSLCSQEMCVSERPSGFMLKGSHALTRQQIYRTAAEVNILLHGAF